MTSRTFRLATGAAALLLAYAFVIGGAPPSQAQEPEGNFGVGIPETFVPKYLNFRARQLADPKPDVMRIRLGFVKGLSRNFTRMVGEMAVDLRTGTSSVTLNNLTPLTTYSVWIVDGADTDSLLDLPIRLTTVLATGPTAILNGILLPVLPLGFTLDRVVVKPGLLFPGEALGAGSVNVFQKIFFRRLTLVNDATGAVLFSDPTTPPPFFSLVPDLAAQTDTAGLLTAPPVLALARADRGQLETADADDSRQVKLDKLISKGAKLFFEETFKGNGRTCGTCHPSNNNFTIDPAFIATLPSNDPLFVAEFNQALFGLERPALMRSDGLILENVDGLESVNTKFVMRGVPHTLGLQVSLTADPTQVPTPAEMTGWSGDGAPQTGSLRDFAIGAVTQHFTKSLNRLPGDFKLPNENQLDAMEAFQLSLGRKADFNLANVTFTEQSANDGKALFINGDPTDDRTGTCNFCHRDGGALAVTPAGQNRNFNTNVEDRDHPSRNGSPDVLDPNFPFDGGFGKTAPDPNPRRIFGNSAFNTASVVEAADTAPFFHNNVERTLLAAVKFYSGVEFNAPRGNTGFAFDDAENDQIADFLRGINTLQNIDVAKRELQEILDNRNNPRNEQDKRLQTAFEETQDAIDVLTAPDAGGIFSPAVADLNTAKQRISQAQLNTNAAQRRALVQQAINSLVGARAKVGSGS
jgi:cytochrome c peroxidase